jgi:DNA ligase (NAD+)
VRERLDHFASRHAMDIDGMGTALIEQVTRELGVRSPDQLFALTTEQLEGLERMGKKSAENVVRALERAKGRGLTRVLVGLAIRHVGWTMAEDLIMEFEEAPTETAPQLAALRTMKTEIEDALVPIMTGLIQLTGLMREG